jgi:amino acid adenylation domain-containing protein
MQEGLLFHALYDQAGTDVYTVQHILDLDGALDGQLIRAAAHALLDRHPNLYAGFPQLNSGQPVQVIPRHVTLAWHDSDLSGLDTADAETQTAQLATDDYARRFDLSCPPLLRFTLLRLGPQHHRLILTHHHILLDGWSMPVLIRELLALYANHGNTSDLPRVTLYRDYLVWLANQNRLEAQQAWTQALAGLQQPTHLATPDPSRTPVLPQHITIEVPDELTTALHEHARRHGLTLNTIIQATWGLLLGRMSGHRDVVFGAVVSGRPPHIPGIETMIGLFINMIPIRVRLNPAETLITLMTRLQHEQSALTAYQHLGLPDIQHLAAMGELFDTAMVFENYPIPDGASPGPDTELQITSITGHGATHYPLSLVACPAPHLHLRLRYRSDLFDQPSIQALADQLTWLLHQIAEDPDRCVDCYSLVPASAAQVLPNPTVALVAKRHPSVRDMIDTWVRATPHATAIEQGDRTCSYDRLQNWADRIRSALAVKGLRKGDVVAIYGPSSPGLIAAMVAVVSSSGVMLTLDHRLPRHRLQTMLTQAHASFLVLVTDDADTEVSPLMPVDGLPLLRIDAASSAVTDPDPGEVSPAQISPDDPAYAFFTSGTTGVPQGVLGKHNALSHFLAWQRDTFKITTQDRCAQLTGLSFDAVLRDVFLPLISGATLCLPTTKDHSSEQTINWLARTGITSLHAVPTLAQAWLEDRADTSIPTVLRYTFFAGEPLTGQLVSQWRRACPATQVINLYGTTETTLTKCWYSVPADCPDEVQPAGRAIPGAQALVFGPGGRLCGVGEIGQVMLRTPYRTLGYLHPPADKQTPFVPNPHTCDPTDLIYPTGDQGRYRPDGTLDILGRLDRQVKIRGVRIETDEVAAVLMTHPDVSQARVTTQIQAQGPPALVAYLTTPQAAPASPTQLRGYLAQRLPPVMVPAVFMFLDHMPRTANGKTDWQALPPAQLTTTTHKYIAPRNPAEAVLCVIWAQVLDLDQVGIEDDFFDLGGHSLLATRLIARIRTALSVDGVGLGLRALFEAPTPAGLAARLQWDDPGNEFDVILPLRARGCHAPVFCIHPLAGISWSYCGLMTHLSPDYPIYGVQARSLAQSEPRPTSIQQMAADYADQIRSVQPVGPYCLLGWSFGGLVAHAIATEFQQRGEQVAFLAILDGYPAPAGIAHENVPAFDEQDMLIAMLNAHHYDTKSLGAGPLSFAKVREILCHQGSALASLDECHFAAVVEIMAHNRQLKMSFTPGQFHGDLLLFTATVDQPEDKPAPDVWRPYIDGKIETHAVVTRHEHMTQPRPLSQIGPVLAIKLEEITDRMLTHRER